MQFHLWRSTRQALNTVFSLLKCLHQDLNVGCVCVVFVFAAKEHDGYSVQWSEARSSEMTVDVLGYGPGIQLAASCYSSWSFRGRKQRVALSHSRGSSVPDHVISWTIEKLEACRFSQSHLHWSSKKKKGICAKRNPLCNNASLVIPAARENCEELNSGG